MAKKTKQIIKPGRVIVCFKCHNCPEKTEVQMDHLIALTLDCPKCKGMYIGGYMGITGIYIKEK